MEIESRRSHCAYQSESRFFLLSSLLYSVFLVSSPLPTVNSTCRCREKKEPWKHSVTDSPTKARYPGLRFDASMTRRRSDRSYLQPWRDSGGHWSLLYCPVHCNVSNATLDPSASEQERTPWREAEDGEQPSIFLLSV